MRRVAPQCAVTVVRVSTIVTGTTLGLPCSDSVGWASRRAAAAAAAAVAVVVVVVVVVVAGTTDAFIVSIQNKTS